MKQTNLTGYIRKLIDLDILEREIPVTEDAPERSKKGLYRIKNHFIEFWFKFVYGNRGRIETGYADAVAREIKEAFVMRHVAYIYEGICTERVAALLAQGRLPLRFDRAGAWWDGQEQIDVCAINKKKKTILFGECKYRTAKMDVDVYYSLAEKAAKTPWERGGRNELFAFFSVSGFTERFHALAKSRKDVFLFDEN